MKSWALSRMQTRVAAPDSATAQLPGHHFAGNQVNVRPPKPRFTALKSTDSSQKTAFLKDLTSILGSCQIHPDTDILIGRAIVSDHSQSLRSG